jgi:cytokinesis protein
MIYISKDALSFVFPASGNLSRFNEVPRMNDPNDKRNVPGCYEYLFRLLESALLDRGKMGSLVGTSEEVRKGGGHDSSFREHAVRFLYLPSGLVLNAYLVFAIVRVMDTIEDMYARLHHRSLMDSAGLQRIITLCREIGTEPMGAQLDELQAILEDDELRLRERYDQEILRDLRSTEDIWNTIRRVTENTDAKEYFLFDATSVTHPGGKS